MDTISLLKSNLLSYLSHEIHALYVAAAHSSNRPNLDLHTPFDISSTILYNINSQPSPYRLLSSSFAPIILPPSQYAGPQQ